MIYFRFARILAAFQACCWSVAAPRLHHEVGSSPCTDLEAICDVGRFLVLNLIHMPRARIPPSPIAEKGGAVPVQYY